MTGIIKKAVAAICASAALLNVSASAFAIHSASEPCPSAKYSDVDKNQWYHDSVDYIIEKGLSNGTSDSTFSPNSSVTRAMFVTMLYRLENEPEVNGKCPFTDVLTDFWYTDAITWASQNNIVTGKTTSTFDPNGYITREQMTAVLYRYAMLYGYDINKSADFSGFSDAAKISAYAVESFKWAIGSNIIQGSDGKLNPTGTATRAQVAAVIMRLTNFIPSDAIVYDGWYWYVKDNWVIHCRDNGANLERIFEIPKGEPCLYKLELQGGRLYLFWHSSSYDSSGVDVVRLENDGTCVTVSSGYWSFFDFGSYIIRFDITGEHLQKMDSSGQWINLGLDGWLYGWYNDGVYDISDYAAVRGRYLYILGSSGITENSTILKVDLETGETNKLLDEHIVDFALNGNIITYTRVFNGSYLRESINI